MIGDSEEIDKPGPFANLGCHHGTGGPYIWEGRIPWKVSKHDPTSGIWNMGHIMPTGKADPSKKQLFISDRTYDRPSDLHMIGQSNEFEKIRHKMQDKWIGHQYSDTHSRVLCTSSATYIGDKVALKDLTTNEYTPYLAGRMRFPGTYQRHWVPWTDQTAFRSVKKVEEGAYATYPLMGQTGGPAGGGRSVVWQNGSGVVSGVVTGWELLFIFAICNMAGGLAAGVFWISNLPYFAFYVVGLTLFWHIMNFCESGLKTFGAFSLVPNCLDAYRMPNPDYTRMQHHVAIPVGRPHRFTSPDGKLRDAEPLCNPNNWGGLCIIRKMQERNRPPSNQAMAPH